MAATGSMQVLLITLAALVMLFVVMYANARPAPQAAYDDGPIGQQQPNLPPVKSGDVAAQQPPPKQAPAVPLTWLRGTNGRVHPKSPCEAVPSLGFWRARCSSVCGGASAAIRREVWLDFATAVTVRAAKCSGPCGGEGADPQIEKVEPRAAGVTSYVINFGACPSKAADAANIREGDLRFDVQADADAAAAATRTCFLSIGDWGKSTSSLTAVAKAMAKHAAGDVAVRFIVSTGDNFYPVGVKSVTDPQFRTAFEEPFNAPELRQMMWLVSAGNHDQWGLAPQLAYSLTARPQPATGLPWSERWYFPTATYSLELPVRYDRSARVVVMNTFGRTAATDLNFLTTEMAAALQGTRRRSKEAIEAAKAAGEAVPPAVEFAWEGAEEAWRIVINHSPMYSGSRHGQDAKETPKIRARVKPVVDRAKAHAYFSGHDHVLEIHRDVATDYFVSGGGGGSALDSSIKLPTTQYHNPHGDIGYMEHCFVGDEFITQVWHMDDWSKPAYKHSTPLRNA
jgi:tartrate-resistant acid phosphatase type 5